MTNKTEIANMSATHLGISETVDDIESESLTSVFADQFNVHYHIALQEVLEYWQPDFAHVEGESLTLIQEDPNTLWNYEYRWPSNALLVLRLNNGNRPGVGPRTSEIDYRIASDNTSKVIWTDEVDACVDYIKNFTSEEDLPASFAVAFSYIMAGKIAPAVMNNPSAPRSGQLIQIGEIKIRDAISLQLNQRGFQSDIKPEVLQDRD